MSSTQWGNPEGPTLAHITTPHAKEQTVAAKDIPLFSNTLTQQKPVSFIKWNREKDWHFFRQTMPYRVADTFAWESWTLRRRKTNRKTHGYTRKGNSEMYARCKAALLAAAHQLYVASSSYTYFPPLLSFLSAQSLQKTFLTHFLLITLQQLVEVIVAMALKWWWIKSSKVYWIWKWCPIGDFSFLLKVSKRHHILVWLLYKTQKKNGNMWRWCVDCTFSTADTLLQNSLWWLLYVYNGKRVLPTLPFPCSLHLLQF